MKKTNLIINILLIIIIIGLIVSTAILFNRYKALEFELLDEYMMDEWLYVNGERYEKNNIIDIDDRYFIEYKFVKNLIYNDIELSNSEQRAYIKFDSKWADLDDEFLNEFIIDSIVDINIPLVDYNGIKYFPLETIARVLFFEYGFTGNDFWVITQDKLETVSISGDKIFINENLNIPNKQSGNNTDFYGVSTEKAYFVVNDENLGYVSLDSVKAKESARRCLSDYHFDGRKKVDEPFYLVWDQINSYNGALNFNNELVEKSADIISPTFLGLNINGIVINEADYKYVQWVHDMDKEVWVLTSNSFNPQWTNEMLSTPVLVDRFISQLCVLTLIYEFDGINIDFENIYLKDQELLNEFMEKLYRITQKMDIPLSIDVTIPEGSDQWSKVYDRKSLAKSTDYIFLMAYDEFWASSNVSGPVASVPWTVEGLDKTLELVPDEKLALGIPGYMRVWKDYKSGNDSSVLSIKNRDNYVEENGLSVQYLPDLMVNYSEKRENGMLIRVWYEDPVSVSQRLDLVEQYNLPGIGLWRRGFIDSETEIIIQQNLSRRE
ncbi:MAG: glycosyl hydrolase family 18 protein [Bacillota bacterium]|nr:glycosyl hydrolase family 18 protein [Bacillota bacterium]